MNAHLEDSICMAFLIEDSKGFLLMHRYDKQILFYQSLGFLFHFFPLTHLAQRVGVLLDFI